MLLLVSSEEDGGQGAFAALARDADLAGVVLPEPTGFDVVCAQAGALTFAGVVRGVGAHAAERLHGASAIDRYLPVHAALAALEAEVNAAVEHPLMRPLELPYPVLVGRLARRRVVLDGARPPRLRGPRAGAAWARTSRRRARRSRRPWRDGAGHVELRWTGATFASAATPPDDPLVTLAAAAVRAERGAARLAGVPWGADFRLLPRARHPGRHGRAARASTGPTGSTSASPSTTSRRSRGSSCRSSRASADRMRRAPVAAR